jgi:hypothetical protein
MITGFGQHKKQPPLSPFFKGEFSGVPIFKGEFSGAPFLKGESQ